MIEAVIGRTEVSRAVLEGMKDNEVAASPGMKYKHYAPKARVIIVDADKKTFENFVNTRKDAFALCFEEDEVTIPKVTFGRENDDESQARELFDALRRLDEMGAQKVYARIPNTTGVGMAVYNRLIRAAAFSIIDLKKPFVIGLTGPSGAGKGYVSRYLSSLGFNVLDSDKFVKNIYDNNSELLHTLADEFGDDILDGGTLNRKRLGEIVFSSAEKRERLNAIVHPEVIRLCEEHASGLAVIDAPQLFEAGAEDKCYKVICVMADKKIRLKRIIERDNISEEQAIQRMSSQLDDDYYMSKSDYVIFNNGENVKSQLDKIISEIL